MYSYEDIGNLIIIELMIRQFKKSSPENYFKLIDSCICNPLSRIQYRKYYNISKKVWDAYKDKDSINAKNIIDVLKRR